MNRVESIVSKDNRNNSLKVNNCWVSTFEPQGTSFGDNLKEKGLIIVFRAVKVKIIITFGQQYFLNTFV